MKLSTCFIFNIATLFLLSLMGCKPRSSPESAFYYWKTNFNLTGQDTTLLQEIPAKQIYLRFFDIKWNDEKHIPFPTTPVNFSTPANKLHIIPVVYITNKTFLNSDSSAIELLANNTFGLIKRIAKKQNISYETIQIDCDWTLKTRDKYFIFLKKLQAVSKKKLEATIRLHQVKYKSLSGIPPVSKGVLMYYNMGKLNAGMNAASSIYNSTDAAKYVSYIKSYPLHLDLALPLFSWVVHIRKGNVLGLYNQLHRQDLENRKEFTRIDHGFQSKTSFFFNSIYVKENDILKLEETTPELLDQAARQLSKALPENNNCTLIFYELSNLDYSIFNAKTFREISDLF